MQQKRTFWFGVSFAFILLAISFRSEPHYFWLLFPLSLALLTIFSWIFEPPNRLNVRSHWLIGILSGTLLYLFFAFGQWFVMMTGLPFIDDLQLLYERVKPTEPLHYIWLFLIIVPGEEWFWRGFIVKRISDQTTPFKAAVYGTLLYAGAHLFTGSLLLVIAALIAGFVWSMIYLKTKNIWAAILSHVIFDLLLLVILPVM